MELADEFESGINLLHSAADKSELLEEDVLSVTSSDLAVSVLLKDMLKCLSPPCLPLWNALRPDLICRGSAKRRQLVRDGFLSGHNCPATASLPCFPDLHTEIEKAWKTRIHLHQRVNRARLSYGLLL